MEPALQTGLENGAAEYKRTGEIMSIVAALAEAGYEIVPIKIAVEAKDDKDATKLGRKK